MNYLEPRYQVPSRPHVTKICRQIFNSHKKELIAKLDSPSVSLTTDIWTSRVQQAYLTVTVHFITEQWVMESKVLLTREMPERHTGINIAERLKEAVREWHITPEKVVAVVRDNAANMVLAIATIGEWNGLGCFGHTLQLAVNAGLNLSTISRLVASARRLVAHFKHSVISCAALKEKQKTMNIPEHSLIQDVSTRWNSTYLMLERLEEQRWALYAVLHDDLVTRQEHRVLDLKADQWELLKQVVPTLKPLQVATTALCLDQNVSASLIFPVINGLLTKHLLIEAQDLAPVKALKELVAKELKRRFQFDANNVAILASAVDPRYKELHVTFMSDDDQELVQKVLLDKAETLYTSTHDDTDAQGPPPKKERNCYVFFTGKLNR